MKFIVQSVTWDGTILWRSVSLSACDSCEKWFHAYCIGVENLTEEELDKQLVICELCSKERKQSVVDEEMECEMPEEGVPAELSFNRSHSKKDITNIFSTAELQEITRFLRQCDAFRAALQQSQPTFPCCMSLQRRTFNEQQACLNPATAH